MRKEHSDGKRLRNTPWDLQSWEGDEALGTQSWIMVARVSGFRKVVGLWKRGGNKNG